MKLVAAIFSTMSYIGLTMAAILAIFVNDVRGGVLYGLGAIAWGLITVDVVTKMVRGR